MGGAEVSREYTVVLSHTYNLKTGSGSRNLLVVGVTDVLLNRGF